MSLRTDASGGLVAGIERRRRQIVHRGQIPREALTDRLKVDDYCAAGSRLIPPLP